MADITLRGSLNRPLTHDEVDANFSNLNADKYEQGDSPSFGGVTVESLSISSSFTLEKDTFSVKMGIIDPNDLTDRFQISASNAPRVWFNSTFGDFSEKLWSIGNEFNSDQFTITTLTDTGSSGSLAYSVVRNSTSIIAHRWYVQSSASPKMELTATTFSVDTNTLFVDAVNNRVGIGTATPIQTFDVRSATPSMQVLETGSGESNRIVLGADTNGAYLNSTFGSGGAGVLRFETINAERMRIDSTGNVGIGTSSPSSPLHINSSSPSLRFQDSTDASYSDIIYDGGNYAFRADQGNTGAGTAMFFSVDGTERMRITSSGAVGIGTSTPSEWLDVKSPNASTYLRLQTATNGLVYVGNNAGRLDLITNGATPAASIDSTGNVGIGTAGPDYKLTVEKPSTDYQMAVGGNVGFRYRIGRNQTDGFLYLYGEQSGFNGYVFTGVNGELMRVTASGGVGIGVTNPNVSLDVLCGSSAIGHRLRGRAADNLSFIQFTDNAASLSYGTVNASSSGLTLTADGARGLYFVTNAAERMRIDSSGNVGIGTSSPIYPLQIGNAVDSAEILSFRSSNTGQCHIFMGDADDVDPCRITYDNSQDVLYFWTNAAERMRIDSSGNVFVGKTANNGTDPGIAFLPTGRMNIVNNNGGTSVIVQAFYNSSGAAAGSISSTSTTTSFTTSSDVRLKENIVDAPSAQDDIAAVQIRSFDWKAGGSHQKYGVVAQELVGIAPEAVSQGETWGVDYSKLVPMMIKAIQELTQRIKQLEAV